MEVIWSSVNSSLNPHHYHACSGISLPYIFKVAQSYRFKKESTSRANLDSIIRFGNISQTPPLSSCSQQAHSCTQIAAWIAHFTVQWNTHLEIHYKQSVNNDILAWETEYCTVRSTV